MSELREKLRENFDLLDVPYVDKMIDRGIALVREYFEHSNFVQLGGATENVIRADERTKALNDAVAAGDMLGVSSATEHETIKRYQKAIEALKDERNKALDDAVAAIPTVAQLINARKMRTHCKNWTVDQILDELIALDLKYREQAIEALKK